MSLSDLASVASVISGIAVAISLIFVGFQLLQNTRAVRASSSQALSLNYQQLTSSIIENNDFARIWRVGIADIADLFVEQIDRMAERQQRPHHVRSRNRNRVIADANAYPPRSPPPSCLHRLDAAAHAAVLA